MRRINVIGTTGSGKTTVARELAARLGVPHVECTRARRPGHFCHREALFDELRAGRAAAISFSVVGRFEAKRAER